ncbi:sentrin-specific protease 1-like [Corticium candelabrum]|uniref:sentrin-specific protease 1-like n=1 Tax=Corticium candelabrum TaxID=121492 RepID=UPI002E260931|nr:sentrin-specific protease 1-like [Corticium candelabrum]XP_062504900.1 sentrin-specific protease 1-like [Corticium candelabrum]
MQKILTTGQESVTGWYRKVDLFGCDRLLCIINDKGNHWTLMVNDNTQKEMRYYDSLRGEGSVYTNALKKYLENESIRRQSTLFDWNGCKFCKAEDISQQENNQDCGVFLLDVRICSDGFDT